MTGACLIPAYMGTGFFIPARAGIYELLLVFPALKSSATVNHVPAGLIKGLTLR